MIKVIKNSVPTFGPGVPPPATGATGGAAQRRLLGHTFLQAPPASSSAWTLANVCILLPGASLKVLFPKGRALPLASSELVDLGPQGRRDGANSRGTHS